MWRTRSRQRQVIEVPPAPETSAEKKPERASARAARQNSAQEMPKAPEENEQSADGFLVQGSVNNAATSLYATNPAFGNTRSGSRGLYTADSRRSKRIPRWMRGSIR